MRALRVCLIDMNNGVKNESIRSFRTIVDRLARRAAAANPGLATQILHVQPRNLGEAPALDCDIYLSTGGPDSPVTGYLDPWCRPVLRLLDSLASEGAGTARPARAAFLVCYSFELAVYHFRVAALEPRPCKFGIMPVYPTEDGMRSELLSRFGDRFFAWENRTWQACNADAARLAELGGQVLARESRDGVSKGPGLVAFRFAPAIHGSIFHPEADRRGVLAWLNDPEQSQIIVETYGEQTYRRMRRTVDDPSRLARTYSLLLPGWLTRRFNTWAALRGLAPVPLPRDDDGNLQYFDSAA